MGMPGRTYTNGNQYRYSINGQEKEPELNDNITTALYWEYDSRIGRRWNVDPIPKDDESPYMTFGNNPIVMVDPNGLDWYKNNKTGDIEYKGKWHGKHKGYESLGKGKGDWLHHDGKDYNKKTGEVITTLQTVTVTAKRKKDNSLMARAYPHFKEISPANVKMWNEAQWLYDERKNAGAQLIQGGENDYYLNNQEKFERTLQAYKDWKATQMAVFVEFPSLFIPVPNIGMFRWFGSATGRVFWSGGGTGGKAFAAATEHALLNGGTTLEMTTAGKLITKITMNKKNWLTGKIWEFGSRQFAKGAAGDIHMFMDLNRVTSESFWFKHELPILTSKGLDIITHIK